MTVLVLALMLALQPAAPWRASYYQTAIAIADASKAAPVFGGELGDVRTAALLVSWFWFESRFQIDAVGDNGRAVGLGQIHSENFSAGVTRDRMLTDPAVAASEALRLLRLSMKACRALPLEERGAWYASGSCERGRQASVHRFRKAALLLR